MRKCLSLAIACFFFLTGDALAGWYHVENFTGTIGPYPIHFSLQTYASFGSGITVEGSYYYDTKDSPIPIYGTSNNGKLALCEIANDKALNDIITVGSKTPVDATGCPFALAMNNDGATGTWSKGSTQYPVALKKVALLDDTDDGKIAGTVEIPFWAQTTRNMFLGVYAKYDDAICMGKMLIVDKATKQTDQEVAFDTADCDAGMVMTPIYLNVQKEREKGTDLISVNFNEGRTGSSKDYAFNTTTNKYSLKK